MHLGTRRVRVDLIIEEHSGYGWKPVTQSEHIETCNPRGDALMELETVMFRAMDDTRKVYDGMHPKATETPPTLTGKGNL